MEKMNLKTIVLAALIGILLGLVFALAPTENCVKVVDPSGNLTCEKCGGKTTMTFDGLCDLCATENV